MPAYMIAQINVTDPEKFARYREAVPGVVEASGGRYIARGSAVEVLERSHDGRRLVLFEFPSMEAIRRFWHSREYASVKHCARMQRTSTFGAVPGI